MAYIPSLPASDKNNAIRLSFSHYDPTSSLIGWDNVADYGTYDIFASFDSTFVVSLTKGATYDIFSSSYIDPLTLSLYDSSGKGLRTDEGEGSVGMDMIFEFVPEYTGDYYIEAGWIQAGTSADRFVWVGIMEDVDTIPRVGPQYGTAGVDVATFKGMRADYSLDLNGENVTLRQYGQPDKQYIGVERFRFDDISIATDINGNAGKAYRLYEAAFDRKPDASGLGFWINGLDYGITLLSIANSFLGSSEFKSRYGDDLSQKDYVTALYLNVLNRAPDQAGTDFWVNALNNGSSRAQVLVNFSESIENQQGVIGAIQNGMEYQFFA